MSGGAQRHLVRFRPPGGHQRPVVCCSRGGNGHRGPTPRLAGSQFAAAEPDAEVVARDLPALPCSWDVAARPVPGA